MFNAKFLNPFKIPIFFLNKIGLYPKFLHIFIPSLLYSGKQINLD